MKRFRLRWAAISALTLLVPASVWATNGMDLEGYGPIALGMGGASLAYDNGTAAVMNNPATLGLMAAGSTRIDLALGKLGPDVSASVITPQGRIRAGSLAKAFYMPAAGIAQRRGALTYGLGVFGQGGMGTEFSASSWLADPSQGANTALSKGMINRSEVSVGRAIAPLAYQVNDQLTVGGSIDFVWAGIDLQMAMSQSQFVDLATTQAAGSVGGGMVQAFGMLYEPFGGMGISRLHHAYFDFTNDSDFTGEASGSGFAAKFGLVYKAAPKLTLGAVYQSETRLGDLKTDAATVVMGVNIDAGMAMGQAPSGQYIDVNIPVRGSIAVKDFEWPATWGAGLAYQAHERVLVVADVRRIQWSGVMQQFEMRFDAAVAPENGGFSGQVLEAVLLQNWEDQTVLALGASCEVSEALRLRAGFNRASNPVPETYLNALFPAIVEQHLTMGAGYSVGQSSQVDVAISRGFESKSTNPGNGLTVPPVESTHGQLNAQIIYSHMF
jgi:long-chain fatty acid transport protein